MRARLLLAAVVVALGAEAWASAPVQIDESSDRKIVEAFLKHAAKVSERLTEAYARKQAAESAESYCWVVLKYQRLPLVAYQMTGDPAHLDRFVRCFKNLRAAMTSGPDGYLGWYGKALKIFRHPDRPDRKVDVIITSYSAVQVLAEFIELVDADPVLRQKYAAQRTAYLDLMENHLVRKWDARGCYVDLGAGGAVFRTPQGLRETKARLTQPHNKHARIIRGLLGLYRVTGNDVHLRKAVKLGTRFKRCLTLRDGHYEWNYWDPSGAWDVHPADGNKWKHWIGVEHKGGYYAATLSQAIELYHHGLVFDRKDIDRFLKTQLEVCWNGDAANPQWARVDGTTSRKYMKGSYMCSALAPFSAKIAEFCFIRGRDRRVRRAAHSWQGGVAAAGWIAGKFIQLPRAREGRPVYLEVGKRFRAGAANLALLEQLRFDVTGGGYRAPRTPAEMKNMPLEPAGGDASRQVSRYAKWTHGPATDPAYFPIAVWLQSPRNARRYRAAGINLYVGLWKGPTEKQLAELKAAGMQVICKQNAVGLAHKDDKTIIGWMHGDEPDNAQRKKSGRGYGPPVLPRRIVEDYQGIQARDPSRPVMLNLGQGVAWDRWKGRGVRTRHPEDYAEYVQGCDIASFDIYPAVHKSPEIAGKLEFVPNGVKRLRAWSQERKIVWNCIEASRISNVKVKPTPHQIRAEVWMSIIHGSRGLIYFVHQFKPKFNEDSLLDDPELLEAVTAINRQVHELAPVLNGPAADDAVAVESSEQDVPIDTLVRRHDGAVYVFAASMRGRPARATFTVRDGSGAAAEVLGEGRKVELRGASFSDAFKPYEVHIYRVR